MSEIYNKYEGSVHTTYADIGKEDSEDPDVWGNVEYKGRHFNMYSDPAFIQELFTDSIIQNHPDPKTPLTVADFGGSEGFVVNLVADQLKQKGYQVHGINIDINKKALDQGRIKYQGIEALHGDLTNIPLQDSSVDSGISRFVMQYMSKKQHPQFLASAYRTLKPGGDLSITIPGELEASNEKVFYRLFSEVVAASINEPIEKVMEDRYTPSGEEVSHMAQEAGFKVAAVKSLTEDLHMWISPKAWASRFTMTPEQYEKVTHIFQKWSDSGAVEFDTKPGTLRAKAPMSIIKLIK